MGNDMISTSWGQDGSNFLSEIFVANVLLILRSDESKIVRYSTGRPHGVVGPHWKKARLQPRSCKSYAAGVSNFRWEDEQVVAGGIDDSHS